MSHRTDKINSLIQREIGQYLQREGYEGIKGLLTITSADVTADLSEAKVYFSVIGQDEKEVEQILKQHIYEIQGFLNKRLTLRKVPRISFILDKSGEDAAYINDLIRRVSDD